MLENIIEQMNSEMSKIKEKQLIDDIFDIYSGKWGSYRLYLADKQAIAQVIKDTNGFSGFKVDPESKAVTYRCYVEPIIISKDVWEYIVKKRTEE